MALTDLEPFPGNAKEHDLDELRRSLRKGQFQPVVVRRDGRRHVVLAGNGTLEAAGLEDWPTLECKVIECTDEEALWVNLAANRIGERAGYDDGALAALLEELEGDFVGTGWDAGDLADLIAACEAADPGPFTAASAPPEPPTRSQDGPPDRTDGADGTRETVILLSQNDYDELHGHLAALRTSARNATNGELLLASARALRQLRTTCAGHSATCECSACTISVALAAWGQ